MPNLWSEENLQKLCFESQIKQYKNDKVIVADNSNEEWLYICMEVCWCSCAFPHQNIIDLVCPVFPKNALWGTHGHALLILLV